MSDQTEHSATIVDTADAAVDVGAVVSTIPLRVAIRDAPAHEGIKNWGWFRGAVLAIAFPRLLLSRMYSVPQQWSRPELHLEQCMYSKAPALL